KDRLKLAGKPARVRVPHPDVVRLIEGKASVIERVIHRDLVWLCLDSGRTVSQSHLADVVRRLLGAGLETHVEVVKLQLKTQRPSVGVVRDFVRAVAECEKSRRRRIKIL